MARQARTHRRKPRNRSGGRLARLAYAKLGAGKKSKGRGWLVEVERLRAQRPGLPSQLREPAWQPDIWEPIPEPGQDRRAYDAWIKFNRRKAEARFFVCKGSRPTPRQLRRMEKLPKLT